MAFTRYAYLEHLFGVSAVEDGEWCGVGVGADAVSRDGDSILDTEMDTPVAAYGMGSASTLPFGLAQVSSGWPRTFLSGL
jgi:hypothetical protein